MYVRFLRAAFFSVILILFSGPAFARVISGYLIDTDNHPLFGANIIVFSQDKIITGTASDSTGLFSLKLPDSITGKVVLEVSSIGYEKIEKTINISTYNPALKLVLEARPIEIGRRVVFPGRQEMENVHILTPQIIARRAASSFVPTNPISAVQEPQVIRAGSNYSAKIRINGTSPNYYLNTFLIGQDPCHYGMFAFLPSSVVKEIKVTEQGTNASFEGPGAVTMSSFSPFETALHGEMNLSLVEATGGASLGGKRYFLVASLRKSVLDKLVRHFDIHSDRRTIPPTNFQDLFLSTGLKISPAANISLDQYYVRDFLSYRSASTSINEHGINASQRTDEKFVGLRFESVTSRFLIKAGAGWKQNLEEYYASPVDASDPGQLNVALFSRQSRFLTNAEITYLYRKAQFTFGGGLQSIFGRSLNLVQKNWNFFPPDAPSDNPYIYQESLNNQYGRIQLNDNESDRAGYLSYRQSLGPWEIENGIRLQSFSRLMQKYEIASRHSIRLRAGSISNFAIFYGNFFENPCGRILEQYQNLIYANLQNLRAVHTRLYSTAYTIGPWRLGFFYKKMERLPHLTPAFGDPADDPEISIKPNGRARFYGGDLAFDKDGLLSGKLDLYTYIGHTRAEKIVDDIIIPYELNARNRFFVEIGYHPGRAVTLGGDLSIHSGNRYTPRKSFEKIQSGFYGSREYYYSQIKNENSAQFPVNVAFNLLFSYQMRHIDLHLSVANVTNHSNAIISTADGYIYDTGILPSFGLKYHF